nr:hypothetical protein [Povalibacter uvarum]
MLDTKALDLHLQPVQVACEVGALIQQFVERVTENRFVAPLSSLIANSLTDATMSHEPALIAVLLFDCALQLLEIRKQGFSFHGAYDNSVIPATIGNIENLLDGIVHSRFVCLVAIAEGLKPGVHLAYEIIDRLALGQGCRRGCLEQACPRTQAMLFEA